MKTWISAFIQWLGTTHQTPCGWECKLAINQNILRISNSSSTWAVITSMKRELEVTVGLKLFHQLTLYKVNRDSPRKPTSMILESASDSTWISIAAKSKACSHTMTVMRSSTSWNLNLRRAQVKFLRLKLVKDYTKKATTLGSMKVTMLVTMRMQRKQAWRKTLRLISRTWATMCKTSQGGLRSSEWMSPSSPAIATYALRTLTRRKMACGLFGLTTTATPTTCCSPLSWTRKSLTKCWAGLVLKADRFRAHSRTFSTALWLVNSSWRQPPTTSACCSQAASVQFSTQLSGKRERIGAPHSISGDQKSRCVNIASAWNSNWLERSWMNTAG